MFLDNISSFEINYIYNYTASGIKKSTKFGAKMETGEKTKKYVHGYSTVENQRLQDQAQTLAELLHNDSLYEPGSIVLEAGCGVGCQTLTIAKQNPHCHFVSVDISEQSVAKAKERIKDSGLKNVNVMHGDIFNLPFEAKKFDHILLCFVLEHLPEPDKALEKLMVVLRPGGTITAIEGDHGSTFFHPHSEDAQRAISCLVELQSKAGGNANIGRELHPLFSGSGLGNIKVSPRMVYVDPSKPELVEGFTKKTFTAMVEGVREDAINSGIITADEFDRGIADLYKTAEQDGVFCYTFFKARGSKR